MIKAKIEKVSISSITENAANPRTINKHKFQKLVNSVREFPEMLSLRPIVVDKDNVILGGNMRYKACKELGLKEVYIIQAADLNDKQAQEFIIKDNVGFGDWDWDALANAFENVELKEWGLDVWQPEEEVSNNTDYSLNTAEEKLNRFLDAKIKNITIPFENEEFGDVVDRLEKLLLKYNCEDYRTLIYKILENEKV
jgi:ParB-like chromosome segregation protein Spo0J